MSVRSLLWPLRWPRRKPKLRCPASAARLTSSRVSLLATRRATLLPWPREVGGAEGRDGAFSEHAEVTPTHLKNWGVFVETFDSGDKVIYNYQGTGTLKDGAFQTGTNKYQIAGGTGKMKGIKGSGSCKLTGKSDGGLDYSCTSEYTLAGAVMAKPSPAKP